MSEKHRRDSFLRQAQTLTAGSQFLGMNTLPKIPKNLEDETYVIGHGFDERPDLLAHVKYGNSRLWWVFSLRNPDLLKDPIRDFKPGLEIIIPAKSSVENYL
jgi:hypothetical protein